MFAAATSPDEEAPIDGAHSASQSVPGSADLPDDISLAVAAVARRLGVAPATLRTWDRRYGLGPSEHEAGSHRRYSRHDLARLEAMQRLLLLGASPAEAARCALSHSGTETDGSSTQVDPIPGVGAASGTGAAARGLTRAASALDSQACRAIISESVSRRGVIATWTQLLAPTLVAVGQKWESIGLGVEIEHLLSESIIAVMQSVASALEVPVNQRPVILSCAPDDLHTLPLFALAGALAERRVSARLLGARVPYSALQAAVRRVGPGAVLVWSQRAETGDPSALSDLAEVRPAPVVLLGGPGWNWQPGVAASPVADLHEAVTRICSAVCL